MNPLVAVSPQNFTNFGELLRFLRERAELSQKQLATEVGYHYSYMSRMEKNQRIPDQTTLMARFVPALYLDNEPEWTARLLELAGSSEIKTSALSSTADSKPAVPPTALPIFDLSSSNIPMFLTPLLGRNEEVVALSDLLGRNDVRLVTLVGPPGVGKTRLAAHLASQLAGQFAHGPLFVDLTAIPDVDSFLPTLAQGLGLRETSDAPLLKSIIASIRHRNILLVLDNIEHIINAALFLPSLLFGAAALKILVTSREALHVTGEHEFPLTPLQFPTTGVEKDVQEKLIHFASVQLFVQRAQSVLPTFKPTHENLSAIAELCRHLDGLPLAIELAAARVKTLSPQTMLQQLDRRLDWLTHGSRDANHWRQTLRGTLEWSYHLLTEPERTLFRRLSVFSGGWTLRAAEAVCSDQTNSTAQVILRREDILDLLIKLVDKSLIVTDQGAEQSRYHLLETMREFGNEKLLEAVELTEFRNRHLAHFAEYAEESESHLDGLDQAKWIVITEKEHNNFRSAIDHSFTEGAYLGYGFRIGAAISLFWLERSFFHEGIERLSALLTAGGDSVDRQAHAKILYRSAAIHARIFNYNAAYKLCQDSIQLCQILNDQRSLASALFYMGDICMALRDIREAKTVLEESISICWNIHFPQQLNMAMSSLGRAWVEEGEYEQALASAKEALAIADQIDDLWGLLHAYQLLGTINRYMRRYDVAIDYFERSLPAIRLIGDRYAEGITLANLSILYHAREDYVASGHAAERSFAVFQAIGDEVQQAFPLRMMGYSAIHLKNIVRARTLILESLKGNLDQGHLSGQLACLVAQAACKGAEGAFESAMTIALTVENMLNSESQTLLEPDRMELDRLLATGKHELSGELLEQVTRNVQMLHFEDIVAQEFPSLV